LAEDSKRGDKLSSAVKAEYAMSLLVPKAAIKTLIPPADTKWHTEIKESQLMSVGTDARGGKAMYTSWLKLQKQYFA